VTTLSLSDRVACYARAFQKWPASHLRLERSGVRESFYGFWCIGNDYRNKSTYHGAYPRGYLDRVQALFPDAVGERTLHAFSGSLPAGDYVRCDLVQPAEYTCDVLYLPRKVAAGQFTLVYADPPYTKLDAQKYGTLMIDRRKTTAALAHVVAPGGFLVWLDTVWPMHRKALWETVGQVAIRRSTNHAMRLVSVFRRTESAA